MTNPSANNGFEPYQQYNPESDKVESGGLKTPPTDGNREAVAEVRAGLAAILAGLQEGLKDVTPVTTSVSESMIVDADGIDQAVMARLGSDQNEGRKAA